jgi:DNA-binding beta-propeller fold protein YncE
MMKHLFQVFLFPFLMLASLVMGSQPTINTFEPVVGPSEGGNLVIMTGKNFTEDIIINFGSTPAHTMILSETIISAVVPPGVPGTVVINMTGSNKSYPCNRLYTYQEKSIATCMNDAEATISATDMTTIRALKIISSIELPQNIAITPDGTKAYVTDVNNDRIIPIDIATRQVQTPIVSPEFKKPNAIAITPDGQLALVTNLGTNSVTLINLTVTPPLVEKSIAIDIPPHEVIISPEGDKTYVPDLACNLILITVTPSQNPVCVGVPVNFSAAFSNFIPTSTPGTLSYFIDLELINTVNVNDIGIAPDSDSITASPGLHLVYATYSGDDVNCSMSSTITLFTVNETAITASADPNPICEGESTTFSAAGFPAGATGTTAFTIGSSPLCTATLPDTSCTTSVSTTGFQTVTATYSGDTNNCGGSTTFSLNVRSLTTTTASASPNPVSEGQPVTLSATVASSGPTPTGSVTFSIGSTQLCTPTLSGGTGSCISSNIPAGTQTITATYSGDANNCPSSTTFTVVVTSIIGTSSPDPSCAGESVTLSATVISATGFVPTGTVTFLIGSQILCTAT